MCRSNDVFVILRFYLFSASDLLKQNPKMPNWPSDMGDCMHLQSTLHTNSAGKRRAKTSSHLCPLLASLVSRSGPVLQLSGG